MKASERREQILEYIKKESNPISASALAAKFGVSRQIIVGDVALLRASGADIAATPRGYVLTETKETGVMKRIVCLHSMDQTEEELNICVDYGCTVLDVIVEHPVYGQLTGELQLASRYDVSQFMEKIHQEQAHSLCEITDGIHLHTLLCPGEEVFQQVHRKLEERNILLKEI